MLQLIVASTKNLILCAVKRFLWSSPAAHLNARHGARRAAVRPSGPARHISCWWQTSPAELRRLTSALSATLRCGAPILNTGRTSEVAVCPFAGEFLEFRFLSCRWSLYDYPLADYAAIKIPCRHHTKDATNFGAVEVVSSTRKVFKVCFNVYCPVEVSRKPVNLRGLYLPSWTSATHVVIKVLYIIIIYSSA